MKFTEAALNIREALRLIDFSVSERNYKALARFPAVLFEEWEVGEREYIRGEVVRMADEKYLALNQVKTADEPWVNVQFMLFRTKDPADWRGKEYVENGFLRLYNGDLYTYTANGFDGNNTPPPNSSSWDKIDY